MPSTATTLSRSRDIPAGLLWGAGALVGFALLVSIGGRMLEPAQVPADGVVVAARNLHFVDRADLGVDVIDADRALHVATVTGQAGFLRGTMRGLASARLRAGLTADAPFRLTAWKDGRLTLDDPTDGRHVELEAFGATNEQAFADLLAAPEPRASGAVK
jgi:putative photosynthetic complex assembly protein